MTLNRRSLLKTSFGATVATAAFGTAAFAGKAKTFASGGVAINGYDPVGYFTAGKPVRGSSKHTSSYNGATWRFASADSKAKFDAEPAKYAPQYGGYCAWAVAKGTTAKTDPDAWRIHKGKLYLNYNKSIQARWQKDIPSNVKQADANWPKVLN